MALYRYVKAPIDLTTQKKKIGLPVLLTNVMPIAFIAVGFVLILLVIYPFFSYNLTLRRWQEETLITPISDIALAESKGLVAPISANSEILGTSGIKVIENIDYSLVDNWFPEAPVPPVTPSRVTHYSLSIPKLKIDHAVVTIGGKKLSDTLIQYPGTALPGEYGNTVIFGHSVLPTFYNPKVYKSIFSLIPTLVKGDKIIIDYDGMQFIYNVENYFEVKPEEIDVLEQRFDQQLLSLITCVPPGTYLRRGVLQTRLTKI